MSSAFFSYWTCDPWTGQVFPCAWDQHDLPPPFRKTNWRPAALSSSGIAAGTPLCQQGGKKIAPHRAARTQTSYLLSSQKVESLLLLCPSAVSNSPEPQSSQQQLSPRIFTSSSQCESSSIPLPLFALSDMHKVQFYRRVPLFGRVLQPPLCSPLSNRALRIHFVGLSLLCTHTTGSSLHQRVFMKDSKKKKKKIPLLSAGETLKAAKPRVSGRRETQCWHPWSCQVYLFGLKRWQELRSSREKRVREDEQKNNSNDGNNRQMWVFARRCRK